MLCCYCRNHVPLSILTPQFPNSHPNLTSRSLYRTSQPPAVWLLMAGEAVSLVTQVSRVQALVCRLCSLRCLHSHPTQVSGCQFLRTEALTRSALVGNAHGHHHREIPQTLLFRDQRTAASALCTHPTSILPPRAPSEGATPELFRPIPWATSVE